MKRQLEPRPAAGQSGCGSGIARMPSRVPEVAPVPLIALLVAPVLACFVGGVVAAATRPAPAPEPEWPGNVIRFDPMRCRA